MIPIVYCLSLPPRSQTTWEQDCWPFRSLIYVKHEKPWLANSGTLEISMSEWSLLKANSSLTFLSFSLSISTKNPSFCKSFLVALPPRGSKNTVSSKRVGHLWGFVPEAEAEMRAMFIWNSQAQEEYKNEGWMSHQEVKLISSPRGMCRLAWKQVTELKGQKIEIEEWCTRGSKVWSPRQWPQVGLWVYFYWPANLAVCGCVSQIKPSHSITCLSNASSIHSVYYIPTITTNRSWWYMRSLFFVTTPL